MFKNVYLILVVFSLFFNNDIVGFFGLDNNQNHNKTVNQSKFIPTINLTHNLEEINDSISLDSVAEYAFSDSFILSDIPIEYHDYLFVELVDVDGITISNRVIIKGYNKLRGRVYINDVNVPCDQNGFFSYEFMLKDFGKQVIYVTFTTLENQFITIQKKLNYLYDPLFSLKDINLKRSVTYFYNLDLFYKINEKKLDDEITRAELAYFLMNLHDDKDNAPSSYHHVVNDINRDDWYYDAVNFVLYNRFMGEFLDGNFYPDRVVTKLEFLVTLVRFATILDRGHHGKLSFQDFPKHHWASKFISASLNFGLIKPSSYLNPDSKITLLDMIDTTRRLDELKEDFSVINNNDVGFNDTLDDFFQFLKPIISFLEQSNNVNGFELDILSHQSNQVVYEDMVVLQGRVFPSLPFFIGSFLVTPNVMGEFSHELELDSGKNAIQISRDDLSNTFYLHFLNGYGDLSGHWLEDLAAKLTYLKFLDETEDFDPKMTISRYDFVVRSYPFFYPLIKLHMSSDSGNPAQVSLANQEIFHETVSLSNQDDLGVTQSVVISDIEYDAVDMDYLIFLIENDVFSLFEENQFLPDRYMTRIEAIAAIVKFLSLLDDHYQESNFNELFPFWDVSMSHWGRPFLEVAYKNRLISKNNNFYPDKPLTKDQLIALLSKTTYAKEQLALTFSDD